MADEATRPFDRRRPVPTGNILQTRSTFGEYHSRHWYAQVHESSCSQNGKVRVKVALLGQDTDGHFGRSSFVPSPFGSGQAVGRWSSVVGRLSFAMRFSATVDRRLPVVSPWSSASTWQLTPAAYPPITATLPNCHLDRSVPFRLRKETGVEGPGAS